MTPKLKERDTYVANAIIQCLETWRRRSHPRPMIVTKEDIEHLAEWAEKLRTTWDWTVDFHHEHGFPLEIIPAKQIRKPL